MSDDSSVARSLPTAQGLQRQISLEERRGRERLADLAESTRRSMTEQQRRLQEIAGQGMMRIQQTRDEGVGKITAVREAAVQVCPVESCGSYIKRIRTQERARSSTT